MAEQQHVWCALGASADSGLLVGLAEAAPAVPGAQAVARGLVMLLAHEDVLVPALVSALVSVLEQR